MDPHLRDLRYFVVVAEELGFQRAADRLFVSQSLLSRRVRQIEDGLRTRLFDRNGRSVTLTAAGRTLLPAARELIGSWDESRRKVVEAAGAENVVLTIGMSTSVGRGLLQNARVRFEVRRPHWTLRFLWVDWSDATAGLADGRADIAFVWLPIPDQEAFAVQVVATEARFVAVRDDHPCAGREQVDFEELLDEPFLALPTGAGPLRDHWLALDERGGRPTRIGEVVSNGEETLAAVERGSGVVLLSEGNAELYRRPGIVAVRVTGLSPSELAVVRRRDDERDVVRDFVEAVCGN